MANLTDTQIRASITKASNGLMDSTEFRDHKHSTVKKLLSAENDVFRNVEAMKKSREQVSTVDMFKKIYTPSGTDKSATHSAPDFSDSFTKDITYVPITQKFKVSYKQANNNRFGYDAILAYELKNKLQSFYQDISTSALAFLSTNRTSVAENSLINFDSLSLRFNNESSEEDFFFENLKACMVKNKYNGVYDVVGDQRNGSKYNRLASQGSTNAVNQRWQLPGIDYIADPIMTNTLKGQAYAWAKGTVGMTTWNEELNREGSGSVGNNEGLFTTMIDPVLGHKHDLHVKRGVADTTGSAGNIQDIVDEYELTTFYAIEGAWESNSSASSIFQFYQL